MLGTKTLMLIKNKFYQTLDNSILDDTGKIIHFSIEKFKNEICFEGKCIICGKSKNEVTFNDEHIFPKWLLRRYNLYNKRIVLPNGASYVYGKYVIPCCVNCNQLMSRKIEKPISIATQNGIDGIKKLLKENLWIFQIWLSLIYFKTHYKDTQLRFSLDQRKEYGMIGDNYDWESLHHIHCIARSFYSNPKIESKVFSTFLILPCITHETDDPFDFGDLYSFNTIMLRLNDTAIIGVLTDSCGAYNLLGDKLRNISGPLSQLQLREVFAMVAYANSKIKVRPKYYSEFNLQKGIHIILAKMPKSIDAEPVDNVSYGKILYYCTKDILSQIHDDKIDSIKKQVQKGLWTFLFNENGDFIKN